MTILIIFLFIYNINYREQSRNFQGCKVSLTAVPLLATRGYKCESISIDTHVKMSNFTALQSMFSALCIDYCPLLRIVQWANSFITHESGHWSRLVCLLGHLHYLASLSWTSWPCMRCWCLLGDFKTLFWVKYSWTQIIQVVSPLVFLPQSCIFCFWIVLISMVVLLIHKGKNGENKWMSQNSHKYSYSSQAW